MSQETQPLLAELLTRYLDRQAEAQQLGIVPLEAEVTPYEAGPVQPIDARQAWEEAQTALSYYGLNPDVIEILPEWSTLVASHEPIAALPLSIGNFPQLVRHFHLLLSGAADPKSMKPQPGQPIEVPLLQDRAERMVQKPRFPQALFELAGLRLAKQFERAERFVQALDPVVPSNWRLGWVNERATLAWHQGRIDDAQQLWLKLEPIVPVVFNRGVAALVLGQKEVARNAFDQVIAQLPDSSSWNHLASVYRTLADV